MNLTLIRNEIEKIGPELKRATERMHEVEPVINELESELKVKRQEFDYLNRNIVMMNQQLRQLKENERREAERERELVANENYQEGYKKIPDFFDAIKEPLSDWLIQNESRFFGLIKPNASNAISKMKDQESKYMDPKLKVMPSHRLAELVSCKNRYYQLSKEIVRLEVDQGKNWQLEKNTKEMLLRDNFASLFRQQPFKDWL